MSEIQRKKIVSFTDLITWQKGHRLVVSLYKAIRSFPAEERFGLADQMRRASVSVTSNIAEGFGRKGSKERIQFYHLANGSLTELKNQLLIARDVGYLGEKTFDDLANNADEVHALLQGLITKTKERSIAS